MNDAEDSDLRAMALGNVEAILTARRRAENELLAAKESLEHKAEQLEQQREWFEVTLSSIGDAVITADVQGHVTFLNPIAEALTGWRTSEARDQPIDRVFQIINQETRKSGVNLVARALQSGRVTSRANHTALIAKDGTELAIEHSAAPIRDYSGNLLGVVVVFRDVTRDRAASKNLRRSERLLTDFFENAAVGLHWVGPDGIILRANQTELDMLGYTKEEYVGQHIAEFHADRPVIDDILTRLTHGECLDGYEARLRCKDGSIRHVLISSNVLWEDGQFVHTRCFTRDVTATKLAEIALREEVANRERAEDALRDADRRKDEFLATLAHELRNPLAPIRQAVLILKEDAATESDKRWSQDVIDRQVQHMALLLDDLLDVSRIIRGSLELRAQRADLAAVIDAAIETARPVIDAKRHRLTIDTPSAPVSLVADSLRISQVLSNLLTNAAKYTAAAGRIWLHASTTDEHLVLSVKDTGIGIPPEETTSIFEMFSQVESSQGLSEGGLGIGLALAKGIVDLHRGTIEAKSAGLGQGSEFVVRLPLGTEQAPDVREPGPAFIARASALRILVADDNRDAAASLGILLQMEGHEVSLAHDGKQALASVYSQQPDVALLDIGMPQMNGYQIVSEVQRRPTQRPVTFIALTGWGQNEDKARARAAGFTHHLIKPVDMKELRTLLHEVARNGRHP